MSDPTLKIIPLGGLGEIGMNCMVIDTGREAVMIDCGLLFSELDHFGVEYVVPDFDLIAEQKDRLQGILITHGHEDHMGALPTLIRSGIDVPIYCSPFTAKLVLERLKEFGFDSRVDLRVFDFGKEFQVGRDFKVRPLSVNHSIIEAAALVLDTPVGRILHTGDFKIDPTPFYGSMINLNDFAKIGDEGVLLMMSDSTNVERHKHSLSEKTIYSKFEHAFGMMEGLMIVSMFASNISRMGQVFDIAKRMNKKVALSGRSMETNVRVAQDSGYLQDAQSCLIPLEDIHKYPRKDIIVLSTGSQGETRSSLLRVAYGEHSKIKIQAGDQVMLSSKFIPGNEVAIGRMINHLFRQGAEVMYEAIHDIHVSGHATKPELEQMIKLVKPKFFIPIHGEYRHLVHHGKVAHECGVVDETRVLVAENGHVIELSPDHCEVTEVIEETKVLVESRDGIDISRSVLKDRRKMGETGVVFVLLVRNEETGKVVGGPEIILKGIVNEEMEAWYQEEAKKKALKAIREYENSLSERGPEMDLQETVRIEVRRFFNANLGKKPVVLPILMDL